jgi:protein TonB
LASFHALMASLSMPCMNLPTDSQRFCRQGIGLAVSIGVHALVLGALIAGSRDQVIEEPSKRVEIRIVDAVLPPKPSRQASPKALDPPARVPKPLPVPMARLDRPAPATAPDAPSPRTASLAEASPAQQAPSRQSGPAPASEVPLVASSHHAAVTTGSSTAAATASLPQPRGMGIGVICPDQVKPVTPPRAVREGLSGMVLAKVVVKQGRVVQVDILKSRPRHVFDAAVRDAVLQYTCQNTGEQAVEAEQEFVFKLNE